MRRKRIEEGCDIMRKAIPCLLSVSYTHLDVYKRQQLGLGVGIVDHVSGDAHLRAIGLAHLCLLYTSRCV